MQSFLKYMPRVQEYVRRLDVLHETWGNLSLLSQLTGGGTDLAAARKAFDTLSQELVSHLSAETQRKVAAGLGARAQVAIDVLVRNLFERTADIGFLAIDDDIVRFMRQWNEAGGGEVDPDAAAAMRERFREYAAKYSVYRNVALLAPDGRVLVQLDGTNPNAHLTDTLAARTLAADTPYVESFGATGLVAGNEAGLVYSYRVEDQRRRLGVLALVFRFQDEMAAIFDKLSNDAADWTVLVLLDQARRVIASSDPWQLPIGAPLPAPSAADGVLRFAGREYLGATCATAGYQGYTGPAGWTAQALLPLEQAFGQQDSGASTAAIDATLLRAAHVGADIFSPELRAVPRRADRIQRDLSRSVWNGNLRQSGAAASNGDNFSGVLLREISVTGRRTQDLFASSIGDLQETVMSSLLQDGVFRASLAADILDRNLYERANDCRWWALNGTLRDCLDGKADAAAATRILEQINGLYTVYDHILLFDRDCTVVAVSRPGRNAALGKRLTQDWAANTLLSRDSQAWNVSRFEVLASYGGRPTWVFTAAVRTSSGAVSGGIAIVFDSAPQVEAMLRDVLPQTQGAVAGEGTVAVFVDREARVIAATSRYQPGETLTLPERLLLPDSAGVVDIVQLPDGYYAAGAQGCGGYREFPGLEVTAIVLRPLGDLQSGVAPALEHQQLGARTLSKGAGRVATFASAGQWLAVPAEQIVEAIEGEGITRIPGASGWYLGVARFGGTLIPVFDLALWNGAAGSGEGGTIMVVEEGDKRFGLLIDQLGDIIDIGADDIVEVDVDVGGGRGAAVASRARAVKFRDASQLVLPMVDVSALLNELR